MNTQPHPKRLGTNIDHVATVRQARQALYPDPVAAAIVAELAGSDQITCHIRGDRRHIQDHDLPRLRDSVQTQLNIEIAATEEMLSIVIEVLHVHPGRHRVTLVPERPEEITTEGGLDVVKHQTLLKEAVLRLQEAKIAVSLFVDPDLEQIEACQMEGVDMIEINTASYAEGVKGELSRIRLAAQKAQKLNLEVAAGHGLTHHNLPSLVLGVPEIIEYNIGHSIVGRALFVGMDQAVRDILTIINS
ncbi:MAG: pyridoxine 5'-phosphate synthase [Proteobacteria bacterium]|nr:pyridoxine 5'-phosphate synthase [Pseudomonadota bacterium]